MAMELKRKQAPFQFIVLKNYDRLFDVYPEGLASGSSIIPATLFLVRCREVFGMLFDDPLEKGLAPSSLVQSPESPGSLTVVEFPHKKGWECKIYYDAHTDLAFQSLDDTP